MSRSNGPVPMAGGPPLQWPESAETAALTARPPAAAPQARRPAMQPPPQVHAAQMQAMTGQHQHAAHGFQPAPSGHQAAAHQPAQPATQHAGAGGQPSYHYPQGGLGGPAHAAPQVAPVAASPRPAPPQMRGAQGLVPPVMGIGQQDFGAPPRQTYAPQFESAFEPAPQHTAAAYPSAQHAAATDAAFAAQAVHPALRQPRAAHAHPQTQEAPARGWPPQQPQHHQQMAPPQAAPPQAVPNPANYDFGSYYPNANGFAQGANGFAAPQPGHALRPGEARAYPDTARGDPGLASLDWQSRAPYPQGGGAGAPGYADPMLDQIGADQDPNAYPPDEMYEGEAEEPPKKGINKWLLVGTLVATIVVGAGMVKGYSWWQGRSAAQADQRGTRAPTVGAIKAPTKIKTTEASTAPVPHQGVTILNGADSRPPEGSTPAKGADDVGAPRKVQTLVFGKDGSLQGSAAAVPPPAPQTAGVPGMIVELPRRPAPEPAPAPTAAPPKGAPPIQPKVITVAPPSPQGQPTAQVVAPSPQPQGRVITVPPRQQVPKVAVAQPAPATSAPAPVAAPTGAGYVAAVVSKKSQMEALTALADLQQKYPAVLQGKTATVQEANLGDKGVWYRVIVGPPGSREAAANVCSQLKGQGFGGCWTFAY